MDKTDVVLSLLLLADSRTSFRDLGDRLGLSVPAVHKRIQAMREGGILRGFTARISLFSLRAVTALVYGTSGAMPVEDVALRLGEHESTYWIAIAGGNYLIVGGYLRSLADLEPWVGFVRKEARIADPVVGILPADTRGPSAEEALTDLDYRILWALHKDSRRPIADVAEAVGVSAKTASRRLARMVEKNLVEFTAQWYPDAGNDIMTFFQLRVKPEVSAAEAAPKLLSKYMPNALFFWTYGNLPNLISSVVWTPTLRELKEIQSRFQAEGLFESIVPNLMYTGYQFDTWRDDLLRERAKAPR